MTYFPVSQARRIRIFRVFSYILLGASGLLFFFDKQMAFASLAEAVLFLLCYGRIKRMPLPNKAAFVLPTLPPILYNCRRLFLFLRAFDTALNSILYDLEVLLLIAAYVCAAAYFADGLCRKKLRITVIALAAVCIALGIWDIMDGTWVLLYRNSLDLGYRIKHYVFYYIPDILFWILPFCMIGSVAYHKEL